MTVQELLHSVPRTELIDYFIPYRFDDVDPKDLHLLRERLNGWIQALIDRPVTTRSDVLLAHISYVEDERFAVSVIKQDEVEKWKADGMRVIEASPEDPPSAYPLLPQIYGIIMSDWDDVLGLQVDESNVLEHDINHFLSEVLQEMSFHGFEEEDMVKERDELIARVDKYDAMTPEEREASCRPMEEVLRELAEEHGFEYHEDTEEEKAAQHRRIIEEMRREYAERYRVMKKYADNHVPLKDVTNENKQGGDADV